MPCETIINCDCSNSFLFELLVNFIGAFFGFGFALIIELWTSRKKEKEAQKTVTDNIFKELKEISESLSKLKNDNKNPHYFRYQYNVWTTCVNSGYIFSVSNTELYNKFNEIYSNIIFANEIEKQYFDVYIRHNKELSNLSDTLDIERHKRRDEILEEIKKLCEQEDKCVN